MVFFGGSKCKNLEPLGLQIDAGLGVCQCGSVMKIPVVGYYLSLRAATDEICFELLSLQVVNTGVIPKCNAPLLPLFT